jgi:hypothetical protein
MTTCHSRRDRLSVYEERSMNRIVKLVSAVTVALGLAVVGLPLGNGGAVSLTSIGSTGCCKQ